MIKWAELIPVICGNYAVGLTVDDSGSPIPVFYDTEMEVLADIKEMKEHFEEQIKTGERDEGDLWYGECHRVYWDGNNLYLVGNGDKPFEEIDWRDQL